MKNHLIFGFILFSSQVFLSQCQYIVNQEVEDSASKQSLPLILKFLNDDIKATIIYNSGKILHTQLKGDILEVDLSVSIICKSPFDQCSYDSAECRGLLYRSPNGELQVLSVDCNPNPPIIEEPLALPVQAETCTGCLRDINIDAEGVQPLVKTIIRHVESERNWRYVLLDILRVQQQVINGVNFFITVKIAPAVCNSDTMECIRDPEEEDIYCVVKFFQEPGYQKSKDIISNNCTQSQTFIPTFTNFESNNINKLGPIADKNLVHEKDTTFKKPEQTENDILSELMSQIIPIDKFESTSKKDVELVQSNPVKTIESSSVHDLVDENGQPIISSSTFQEVLATEDQPISLGTDTAGEQVVTSNNPAPSSDFASEGNISPSTDITSNPTQAQNSVGKQTENIVEVTSQNVAGLGENVAPVDTNQPEIVNEHMHLERVVRSAVNSEKLSAAEKSAIQDIADYVASTLDLIDDDNHKRVVLQIINVKKIRAVGLFLNMNLRIGVSKCGENESASSCKKDLFEDLNKFCKVQVQINDDFKNPKVVKSHCENEKRNLKSNRTSKERRKRALLGGKQEISVHDPRIQQYLGEAENYLNANLTQGDKQLKISRVLSATSQVVSGVSYDIKVEMSATCPENSVEKCDSPPKLCDINVWYQPWLNSRQITIDCGGPKVSFNALESHKLAKRALRGGWSQKPTNDPIIAAHLNSLLSKLDSQSGKDHKLKIKEIKSASSQVVAGTNWKIDAKVALSDCPKSDSKKAEDCGENKDSFETVCEFKFWEKLPDANGVRELDNVKVNCDEPKLNYIKKDLQVRSLPGGWSEKPTDNPKIAEHLNSLLSKMDSQSGKDHKLKIKKIISVSSQVVAGTNWKIEAKVALSDCSKSDSKKVEDCGENKDTFETVCEFKFWEKLPDANGVRELDNVKVNCGEPKLNYIKKERQVRSLPGGWSEKRTDNPKIAEHLNSILSKMDSQSGKDHKLKIKRIISVSSQVVAGTNWKIEAEVALSDCSKSDAKKAEDCGDNKNSFETVCEFKFWEKLPDANGVRELDNVKVNCDEPKLNYIKKQRNVRQVLGGYSSVSNDDSRILEHLTKLLPHMDSQSGKEHKMKIESIISASEQTVAGTNWDIKAKVALSDCKKSDAKNPQDCGENKDTFKTVCDFKFWEKLPNNKGVREFDNIQIFCGEEPNLNYIWKQPDIIPRKIRQIVGGHNAISTEDPRISNHLNKLLPHLVAQSGKDRKVEIVKVLSATTQVVAGTNWNIKAKVTLDDCLNSDAESCGENKNSLETVCNFKFWEKLPDKNGVRKLDNVEVNCEDPKLNYIGKQHEVHRRTTRQVLVGGHNPVSKDDPRIVKHLNKLLPTLDTESGNEHKFKITEIKSATTQVVAGTNWNIEAEVALSDCLKSDDKSPEQCNENQNSLKTVCKFKFWEKLPNKDGVRELENVQVTCDDPKMTYRSKREVKRQVIGGHNAVSNDDPQVLKHLYSVLPKLESDSGNEYKYKVKEIISASKQVVAGTNWKIKAKVVPSDCRKSDEKKPEDCGENQNNNDKICVFKFWEKLPDENGVRVKDNIEVNCNNEDGKSRKKRDLGLPGGEHEVDKNDPLIYEYLTKGLQHIDLNSPHDNKYKVKEILSVTKQVVEGDLWRIKVNLVLSDCSKNDVTVWDQCGDLQGSESKICTVKVWDRPWIAQGRETNITCENQKTDYTFRSKRTPQLALGQDDHDLHFAAFQEFERTYNKHYSSPKERIYRFSVFRENMKYIKKLNEHEQGTAVYGPTKFADLTRKEFSKSLGYRSDLRSENDIGFLQAEIPDVKLPDSFDWREKNAVAKVKNQGSCGSCWAFSVTGNVEGQYAIKNGQLLEFSEQELVDCDTVDQGCNGGLMDNAYRQIEKLGGLEQEKDYPYDAEDEKCHFDKSLARVQLSGAVNISTDETDMAKWLTKNGPISIAINANAMQFYVGGVSHPWKFLCNPKNLDHGVLIVGYGVHTYPKFKKSLPYWIVKNSWGPSWGEQGYYRVYRGDGTCGVNQTPSSAILQ